MLLLLFVVVGGVVIVGGVVVVVVVDVIELLLLPNIVRMVEDTVDVGLVKLEFCSMLECKRKARETLKRMRMMKERSRSQKPMR